MTPAILALAAFAASTAPGGTPSAPAAESDAVMLSRFAECAASRWRRVIVTVLQEVPGTTGERDRLGGANGSWGFCTDPLRAAQGRFLFQPDVMRGPLTEALFERDFPPDATRRTEAPARLPDPTEIVRRRDPPEAVLRAAIIGVFAACVVDRHPTEAAAVLATSPGSRAETAAIQLLAPEFGSCFPAGSQFDITIPLLRGYLAGALYRRAAALAAAPPGVRQ